MAFSAAVSANSFEDTKNHWAKYSIDYATEKGYFHGVSTTKFEPDMPMTRAMFVTVISRMVDADLSGYDTQVFTDVVDGEWYSSAVNWAYDKGIVAGVGNNEFSPQQPITREQICVMLENYFKYTNKSPEEKNQVVRYLDNALISDWAYDEVYQMQKYGLLVGGTDNTFRPGDNATRAECAAIFARVDGQFFGNYVEETPTPPDAGLEGATYLGEFYNTFYCPGYCCNGKWAGMTSTGAVPTPGVTIAVDPDVIPLGSTVYIEFLNESAKELNGYYVAQDVGGGVSDKHIDVLVSDHEEAYRYGVGYVNVYLIN